MDPVSIGLTLLPSLAKWIFGEGGAAVAKEVTGVAREIFATDDPAQIERAIATAPELAFRFKEKLLDVQDRAAQRQHAEFIKVIEDRQSARGLFAAGAGAITSRLAWITVTSFFAVNAVTAIGIYLLLTRGVKVENPELAIAVATVFGNIMGWVNAKTDMVYNFFFGSSAGSKQKDDNIAGSLKDLARKVAGAPPG